MNETSKENKEMNILSKTKLLTKTIIDDSTIKTEIKFENSLKNNYKFSNYYLELVEGKTSSNQNKEINDVFNMQSKKRIFNKIASVYEETLQSPKQKVKLEKIKNTKTIDLTNIIKNIKSCSPDKRSLMYDFDSKLRRLEFENKQNTKRNLSLQNQTYHQMSNSLITYKSSTLITNHKSISNIKLNWWKSNEDNYFDLPNRQLNNKYLVGFNNKSIIKLSYLNNSFLDNVSITKGVSNYKFK